MNKVKKAVKILFATFLFLNLFSCTKENNSFVPYVPVNFYISLANYNHLTIPTNSITFKNKGYAGLIVMCVNSGQYYAFEACCPYETLTTCPIELNPIPNISSTDMIFSSSVTGKCKCCGSEYMMFGGGYSVKGPSSRSLQQYQVDLIGGRLWVHN